MRNLQIVVIGASDENRYNSEAYQIGQYIAENGYVLLTGGGSGIMEAVSRGAYEHQGTVIGILPGGDINDCNPYCTVSIPTGIGYARNAINILASDLVIAIGGKAGTLSELTYAWMYHKPVIACSFAEGWSKEFHAMRLDERQGCIIYEAETVSQVCEHIEVLCANT